MKHGFLILASVCNAAFFLSACSLSLLPSSEYTQPKTYDIAVPAPIPNVPFRMDVQAFSSEGAGRYKMVFREEANRIGIDEFNRWAMPPGAMLTKYLSASFAAPAGDASVRKNRFILDGSVLSCELDRTNKTVELLVHYEISSHANESYALSGTVDYKIPVQKANAESFADGLGKAAAQFAAHIAAEVDKEIKSGRTAALPASK